MGQAKNNGQFDWVLWGDPGVATYDTLARALEGDVEAGISLPESVGWRSYQNVMAILNHDGAPMADEFWFEAAEEYGLIERRHYLSSPEEFRVTAIGMVSRIAYYQQQHPEMSVELEDDAALLGNIPMSDSDLDGGSSGPKGYTEPAGPVDPSIASTIDAMSKTLTALFSIMNIDVHELAAFGTHGEFMVDTNPADEAYLRDRLLDFGMAVPEGPAVANPLEDVPDMLWGQQFIFIPERVAWVMHEKSRMMEAGFILARFLENPIIAADDLNAWMSGSNRVRFDPLQIMQARDLLLFGNTINESARKPDTAAPVSAKMNLLSGIAFNYQIDLKAGVADPDAGWRTVMPGEDIAQYEAVMFLQSAGWVESRPWANATPQNAAREYRVTAEGILTYRLLSGQ